MTSVRHSRPKSNANRPDQDHLLRPGRLVSGRLPSPLMHAAGKPDFKSWTSVSKPRGIEYYASLFGSALATGKVVRVICEKPAVAEIERPKGKTAVVLVTRIHGEAA